MEKVTAEPMVMVRLIWPATRGPKNDCRGQTNVVWAGHGDIQPYPARLWPKLAEHRDVWELVDANVAAQIESTDAQEEADRLKKVAMARQILAEAEAVDKKRADAEELRRQELEKAEAQAIENALAAQKKLDEAAGKNTDVVIAKPNDGRARPAAAEFVYASAEQLDQANDESIRSVAADRGYDLHPRLNPANLRLKFLEAQMADDRVVKPTAA